MLLGGAAFYVGTRHEGPHYPKEWDPRVLDLVSFDEKERGLTFKHPVEIEFMTEDDFKAEVTTSDTDLSDEDKAQITQTEASFRALGLIGGDVDLFKAENDIQGGGTLAYYSPEDKKVRVRGTDLDVATRVTLAHELTHALQDQYYDLSRLQQMKSDGEATAFRALVEGDATVVENAYIDQLSATDSAAYDDQNEKQADTADYGNDPQVLVATFTSPYIIGPPFVEALKAKGGNNAINDALQDPPTSEAALLDIFTFLDKSSPTTVDTPTIADGDEHLDDGDFGATTWYLMLARRLDVHQAVKAVDGWGGDSYVTYSEADGRVCVRARYQGKTQADTDRMHESLQQWLSADPTEGSSVSAAGSYTELTSCDPGSSSQLEGDDRSMEAIEMLGLRLQVVSEAFKANATSSIAECSSNGLVDQLDLSDLDPDADQEAIGAKVQAALTKAIQAC
ncbi:MAG: DUF6782 family putative metallopeptidase [Acidimicrobiales bacterium]